MSMKINKLEIENVKRVKAVKISPTQNGLTVIGGRNGQGKTSVLDAIAWALGGDKFKPSQAAREGSVTPPSLKIVMQNGLIVERTGKNSTLKVTDPKGEKGGQRLLDEFVEKLALDLPKFLESSDKEKAAVLLHVIGVDSELTKLEKSENELYQERLAIGRIADQKEKFAKEQPYYTEAPDDLVSPADLIKEQQEILARNGQREQWKRQYDQLIAERMHNDELIEETTRKLHELTEKAALLDKQVKDAAKSPNELKMESTAELEESIANIDEINRKVRANLDKEKAEADAANYRKQYQELDIRLNEVRQQKIDLLRSADLPLPGLTVVEGELVYRGQRWDNMSSSEQLRVATAIIRKINPECGFVLLDKLEQMDLETLNEFGAWLETEGLQAIATRVSTGEECSIIIEDGYAVQETKEDEPSDAAVTDWRSFEI
jgi:DNA repair exonuclease SbcCD ATPase subunit|nr:MAG TPA: STRUCTURAL MAINTENANCE OF CHROMOSOMES PROTEIN [Caudoviricetes sp.]